MSRIIKAINPNPALQSRPVLSKRSETRGESGTHSILGVTMVLDSLGVVRYCHANAARLFRTTVNTLIGRYVTEFIPDLPFTPRTPGYNVGYAAYWASQGLRSGFCGVDSQGRSFGLRIALDLLETKEPCQIIVALAAGAPEYEITDEISTPAN